MAFVKLNNRRVPLSSIKEYSDCPGISKITGKPYCTVKIYVSNLSTSIPKKKNKHSCYILTRLLK